MFSFSIGLTDSSDEGRLVPYPSSVFVTRPDSNRSEFALGLRQSTMTSVDHVNESSTLPEFRKMRRRRK